MIECHMNVDLKTDGLLDKHIFLIIRKVFCKVIEKFFA